MKDTTAWTTDRAKTALGANVGHLLGHWIDDEIDRIYGKTRETLTFCIADDTSMQVNSFRRPLGCRTVDASALLRNGIRPIISIRALEKLVDLGFRCPDWHKPK